jgi:hypothetical protein
MHGLAACIATPSLSGLKLGQSKKGNHVKLVVGNKNTAKLR